ncbi:hypothetical protein PSS96_002459 [Enterococcus faecium]|nr:hypothetical protein [Enterococcus faecium]EME7094182.1 hypothetical protein [Enterococcus faecium]EME7139552.1 hypothetical protein [Enterococcus faecium]
MNRKRYSIRFPEKLAFLLEKTSVQRGLSVNALVTELCWQFVEDFERKYGKIPDKR